MEQLQFVAVHEDGQQVVLVASDGTEYLLSVDERLRSALRSRGPAADIPAAQLRPRDVQAMFRAGHTAAEVAEITGWPAERVSRFEGPITAEREHIAGLCRAVHVRGRGADGVVPTLEARVLERLEARGVDPHSTRWDATRPVGGAWTVLVSFVAGQRQRSASWHFDPADRTVEALDDEARWLSEDEQALPGSATGKQLLGSNGVSEEVDLVTSMRERSRTRSRRKKPAARGEGAGEERPTLHGAVEDELPLEHATTPAEAEESDRADDTGRTEDADTGRADDGGRADGSDATGKSATGKNAAGKGSEANPTGDKASATGGDSAKGEGGSTGDAEAKDETAGGHQAGGGGATAAPTSRRGRGRGKVARGRGRGRATAPAQTITPDKDADTTADKGAADSPAPAAPAVQEVELDFDENYEVDPTPQEATLADLFGEDDSPADELPVDEYDDLDLDVDEDDDDNDETASQTESAAAAENPAGQVATAESDEQAESADQRPDGDEAANSDAAADTDEDADVEAAAEAEESAKPEPEAEAEQPTKSEPEAEAEQPTKSEQPAEPEQTASPAKEKPQPGAKRRKDGRPGVPSWDDIMFGAKDRN